MKLSTNKKDSIMALRVAIIGAGIAGLTTGILLRQQGAEVTIFEKRSCVEPIGGGLGIWPNGTQTLLNLPCASKVIALAGNPDFTTFGDAHSNTLTTVPSELYLQINGHPTLTFSRGELHQVLAEEFGDQQIIFNAKCIAIEQSEAKGTIHFDSGQSVQADLIIGADGIYSTVRKILFPENKLEYASYIQLLGILRYPKGRPPKQNFIWGENRYCLSLPISNNRYNFYHVMPLPQGKLAHEGKTREDQVNLFRGWSKEVDWMLDILCLSLKEPEFQNNYYCGEAYHSDLLPRWHCGRIVLLGDAAHPMGSILALGGSAALEDSYVLCNYLKNANSIKDAIDSYETHQMYRAAIFAKMEREITDFLTESNSSQYSQFIAELKDQPSNITCESFIGKLKRQIELY